MKNIYVSLLSALFVVSLSVATNAANSVYGVFDYSNHSWANHFINKDDPHFVALLKKNESTFAVYMNQDDSRGYRSLIRLMHADMLSTYNRSYSLDETTALFVITANVVETYERLGLIGQTEYANNNSHDFDANLGATMIGTAREPNKLMMHVRGRGNPNHSYIPGVPLRGPAPGHLFNQRADDKSTPGNDAKTKWGDGEMALVAEKIAATLEEVLKESTDIEIIAIRSRN